MSTATASPLLGVYTRPDLVLSRGEGCRVWDEDGRSYLDFTSGIAVNALGYGSPVIRDAIEGALDTGLVHTSNLFRTRPAEELAELLVARAFPGKVFFCNSGAEANEAAFKFARRWAAERWGVGARPGILAFRGSFHGRLFGSLAATDRPAYREPFQPLMPGVRFADVGDKAGVARELEGGDVSAVVVEPLQAEGGVRPLPEGFLAFLREACDEGGALLVVDEVQCGLGRTGRAFAYQDAGIVPDIMTLAKPLAGGLPMGAVVVGDAVAAAVRPGDHATTFGGGPLVASVARAVVARITDEAFLAAVRERSGELAGLLEELVRTRSAVREERGRGLLRGLVLEGRAAPVVRRARELGLLVVGAGPDVVRLLPPLTVSTDELGQAVEILAEALS